MKRVLLAVLCCSSVAMAQTSTDAKADLKLQSIGPMAFGPHGVLLIGDPKAATIYAIETGDTQKVAKKKPLAVKGLNTQIADMLGIEQNQVRIHDLAINPLSGRGFVGVSRGRGPDAVQVVLTIDGSKIKEFSVAKAKYSKAVLPNVPNAVRRRGGRMDSLTDMAFVGGKVVVAGLSNEEFASKLRTIDYPFAKINKGTSVEIYHGAHGKLETRSPVRTFTPMIIDNEPHLLAAYTCTPLVKFPVSDLSEGKKIRGTTVAELGNRNRPLDMVAYKKDGKDFLLVANSARGVMKVDTATVGSQEAIMARVSGGKTAGLPYETIKAWDGVMQLEHFSDTHCTIVVRHKSGEMDLRTVALP